MPQNQELKQQDQPENRKMPVIYVGPFQGKWSVSENEDIFGEPFYIKEQAITEAKRRVEDQKKGGDPNIADIKVYNEETKEFEVL